MAYSKKEIEQEIKSLQLIRDVKLEIAKQVASEIDKKIISKE